MTRSSAADARALERARIADHAYRHLPVVERKDFDAKLAEVRQTTRPAMLWNLRSIVLSRGLTPRALADLTGLTVGRLKTLMHLKDMEEPWLDEAVMLSRVLRVDGVLPLIGPDPIALTPMGVAFDHDLASFWSGERMSLSLGLRVALKFALNDPIHLQRIAVGHYHPSGGSDPARQIWSEVASNARGAEPGMCPWCLSDIYAGAEHLPTCLPHNLWGTRNKPRLSPLLAPIPSRKHARRARAGRALGLKHVRDTIAFQSQEQMATNLGVSRNHFALIEQGNRSLTQELAEKIAAAYHVPVATLYEHPAAGEGA